VEPLEPIKVEVDGVAYALKRWTIRQHGEFFNMFRSPSSSILKLPAEQADAKVLEFVAEQTGKTPEEIGTLDEQHFFKLVSAIFDAHNPPKPRGPS